MKSRAIHAFLLAILAGAAQANQAEPLLQPGSYAVTVRLELPNAEQWATDKTLTICLPSDDGPGAAPIPVLSDNNRLATCPATSVMRNGAELSFEIVCQGPNAAKALAVHALEPHAFAGRIAMTMGGKNMTMTEVQVGRRVGDCDMGDGDGAAD
jgi:hypothetical protein